MLSNQDVTKLIEAQRRVFMTKEEHSDSENRVVGKFSDLQTSVDRYLKFTEAWHQELTILKNRQDRLTQVLIDKGVVSQQEVALLV